MLNGVSKLLTGDMLKALSDMGHGDVVIIADANFPGDRLAPFTTVGKTIRCPGVSVSEIFDAISPLFPLDFAYTEHPAAVMDLTDGDKKRGLPTPAVFADFTKTLKTQKADAELGKIERMEFYERAKRAYVIIETGEERIYGNLLLVKGCVL